MQPCLTEGLLEGLLEALRQVRPSVRLSKASGERAMEAVAIRYRKPGTADIGEASWMGLANLIMSGELPAETEVFTHEDATVAEAGASLCSVADLIDISEAAEADADDADEIAATLQESFAALAAPPEPEPEPAHSMPSPIESLSDV